MIYSPLVKKACAIMYDAHKEDMDKAGYPYVLHPFTVAFEMEDELSTCVALLHDVIEDHGDRYSFETMIEAGFPPEVIDALRLLTHGEGVPYLDYVRLIAKNPIARKVKIADLRHNMDTTRLDGRKSRKYDTYVRALAILEGRDPS